MIVTVYERDPSPNPLKKCGILLNRDIAEGKYMKLGILTTTGLLIAIGFASGVKAENVSQVKQLLETKKCSKCDLTGAQLAGMNLSGADLTGANLRGANLNGANLNGSDLTGANLKNANMANVDLKNASLP